ncbi:MAG: GNAT family N-acetyltransferase [Candidatus Harrisonbacteria bacterium]|nr:GNAT family N-acetyltransferase [Candidatus Harrisonbacteria bacterium]
MAKSRMASSIAKSPCEIRLATPDDLPGVAALAQVCFPQDNGTAELTELWHRSGMAAYPKTQYFVAVREGCIIGYCSWSFIGGFHSGVIELEQLGVHPDHRNQGVATVMMKEGLTAVRAFLREKTGRELHAIKVDTATDNTAQAMYRRVLGTEVEATLKDFLFGNDEVIMLKRFSIGDKE